MLTIKNWVETFECPTESRRPKGPMAWCQIPVDNDSSGKRQLFRMGRDGYIAYSVFICLIQWSAGKPIEMRGKIGNSDGSELNALDVSEIVRMDIKNVEKSLDLLVEIGWLNRSEQKCSSSIKSEQKCAYKTGQNKTEQNRTEQDKTTQNRNVSFFFDQFWSSFPSGRKTGKKSARAAFVVACKDADPEVIIAAAKEYSASDAGKGPYVKGPTPWLNQGCWDDDRDSWKSRDAKPVTFQQTKSQNSFDAVARFTERHEVTGSGNPRICN